MMSGKNLFLSLTGGLLLGLPWSVSSLFFVVFIAWVPLLVLEEETRHHPNRTLHRHARGGPADRAFRRRRRRRDGRRAVIWSRSDRPARLFVEWSTRESFADARRVQGGAALEADGLTARLDLEGLPPGQRIVYRVLFQDLRDPRAWSLPVTGSFRTPPAGRADVRLAFSADTCGQGWGIDEARGGLATYESMLGASPDLFVHLGDTIYADNPLPAEIELDDGGLWRNLGPRHKAKVAETLGEFRRDHLYYDQVELLRPAGTGLG